MKKNIYIYLLIVSIFQLGCKKDFLEAKPRTSIVTPTTLAQLQGLLENSNVVNLNTPQLSQMACDDYIFVDYTSWLATGTATERNSYVWAKDLFGGETLIQDWNTGFTAIFYCNSVLDALKNISVNSENFKQYRLVEGWALFVRAFTYFDLARNFAAVYNPATAATDLGLPMRLKSGIDEIEQRATLKATYERIFADLEKSKDLLEPSITANSNRPWKAAAYALFSRICLSIGDYARAELYADSTLALHSKLIDYNTISKTSSTPFAFNNDETIYSKGTPQSTYTIVLSNPINNQVTINPDLIKLYDPNDLRLAIYFATNPSTGTLYSKRRYLPQNNCFTGLATDEVLLNKAECLARRNEVQSAMILLNQLLKKRFTAAAFKETIAVSQVDAIGKILLERRKELVWRTLRWADLKRLNKDGANINIARVLNGITYNLPANDARYIFPIPDDEIAKAGLIQNVR